VRRVDDVDRRWHSGNGERYAVLRPGQWTLRDLEAAFVLWRAGERYVRGLGPACEALMNIFFGQADARPEEHAGAPDVAAIFQAIVDAAQAAQGAYGTRDVLGWQAHATVMEWVAQVESLARSGLVVCGIKTCLGGNDEETKTPYDEMR